MTNVTKLPYRSRATFEEAEALRQKVRDLNLSEEARAEIDSALYKITHVPGKRWAFVMISQEQFTNVALSISKGPSSGRTLLLWNLIIASIRQDTGEVIITRDDLAEAAQMLPNDVSRSLTILVNIGALIRLKRGRRTVYFLNARVGWKGSEGARLEAEKLCPPIRLVTENGAEV